MRVLFVSVEMAPFAKVGGLADVIGSLPKALRDLGHDARVVMPLYKMIEDDPRWKLTTRLEDMPVVMSRKWSKKATFKEMDHEGLPIGFIGCDEWFPNAIDSSSLYQPGGMQYLFLACAAMQIMERLDWVPDVVHCHDWHMGFLPVIMREKGGPVWDRVGAVYTIHNQAYQGEFGPEILDSLDLSRELFRPEAVEAWGRVNFLKAGCAYSDRVNTVSETYAREIQTAQYGATLEGLMAHLSHVGRLSGILNGIDMKVFDPATDPALASHFSAEDPSGKQGCRAALLKELKLDPLPNTPVVGMISRLSSQKGYDLLLRAAKAILDLPVQLIVQGLGDPVIIEGLRRLQEKHPKQVRFAHRFDADLAQHIYSGCDAFLMPSAFEPCGLGQLIAMRYGTVPIVRSTGGLADTVFEGTNGFVFNQMEPVDLIAAVARMREAYSQPERWKAIQHAGLAGDFSWQRSATKYVDLYEGARGDRLEPALTA